MKTFRCILNRVHDITDTHLPMLYLFSYLTSDSSDPTYEPIEKITCFSAPISASMVFKQTLQEAYENFLQPLKKNLDYQSKQPAGVRYTSRYCHQNRLFEIIIIYDNTLVFERYYRLWWFVSSQRMNIIVWQNVAILVNRVQTLMLFDDKLTVVPSSWEFTSEISHKFNFTVMK